MKAKNLKKLILLGLTSLLTANFSVCAMEEKNEININTNIIQQEQDFDDELYYKNRTSEQENKFYEGLLVKGIDSSDKVQEIYETTKKEYEEVKKLYDNLCKEAENLESGKLKYNTSHDYFKDYEKILKFVGLLKENRSYLHFDKYNLYAKETYESSLFELPYKNEFYAKNDEITKFYLTPALIKLDCALNYMKNLNPKLQQRNEELKNNIIELHNKIRFLKNKVSRQLSIFKKDFQLHIGQSIENIIYSVAYYAKKILEKNPNDLECKNFVETVDEKVKEPDDETKKDSTLYKYHIIKYTPKSIDELETNIEKLKNKLNSAVHLFKIMPGYSLKSTVFEIEPSWLRKTFIESIYPMKNILDRAKNSLAKSQISDPENK